MGKGKKRFDWIWLLPIFVFVLLASVLACILWIIANADQSATAHTVVVTQETVSYTPAQNQGLSGEYLVCLDAGHGGRDPGTQDKNAHYEKTDNLEFALLVKQQLLDRGISVLLTRSEDRYVALEQRADIANEAQADLFLSFHRNYSDNPNTAGIQGWVNKTVPQEDYNLAYHILKYMNGVGDTAGTVIGKGTAQNRNTNYLVNARTQMPSVLLELGYMSNEADNRRYAEYKAAYAKAVADGVVDWLSIFKEK